MSAKVLLVDDSKTALLMGETVFKQHTSCQVVTARDGQEGVQKALSEKPDLILLDVVMPKMDGFAACQEMRKHESLRNVPIIMVTSRGEPGNVATGYSSGCNAYLTKPINARELLEIVGVFLGFESKTPMARGAAKGAEKTAIE
jgi:CheY-like chemotaxis protein